MWQIPFLSFLMKINIKRKTVKLLPSFNFNTMLVIDKNVVIFGIIL